MTQKALVGKSSIRLKFDPNKKFGEQFQYDKSVFNDAFIPTMRQCQDALELAYNNPHTWQSLVIA